MRPDDLVIVVTVRFCLFIATLSCFESVNEAGLLLLSRLSAKFYYTGISIRPP